MSADPGPYAAFYESALQHPILLWLAAGLALAYVLTRSGLDPRLRRYCIALAPLSVADAWLTSNHVYGIGTFSGAAASAVPLFFVVAGDLRYLLLVTSATTEGSIVPTARRVLTAVGLSILVPSFAQSVVWSLPESLSSSRVLFLVYELSFMVLVGALWSLHPQLRSVPWLRPVSGFVLLYYALWASADVILLATGSDLGFALRVVPNLLYYGGLIAVIAWASTRRPLPQE